MAELPFGGLAVAETGNRASLQLPLLLLERFLYQNQPLGKALHDLRHGEPAVGLLIGGLVPGQLQVEGAADIGTEAIKSAEPAPAAPWRPGGKTGTQSSSAGAEGCAVARLALSPFASL